MSLRLFFLSLLLSTAAIAQAQDTANSNSDRWFDIEAILFTQQAGPQDEQGQEVWPMDPGAPETGQVIELAPAPPREQDQPLPLPFALLPESEWLFSDIAQRLNRSPQYALITHFAWQQPAAPSKMAEPIHVRFFHRPTPDKLANKTVPSENRADAPILAMEINNEAPVIEGTIRISRNHYLHIDVDLIYNPSNPLSLREERSIDLIPELPLPPTAIQSPESEITSHETLAMHFRMKQSRRVKREQLHYFDHPYFGLLISLRPIKSNQGEQVSQ